MITRPTSFKDWQSCSSKLDPIHLAWLKQAKKSKIAFLLLKILLTKAKINPLHHRIKVIILEEIPKLGRGKTDFDATKKIALVNDQ